MQQYNNRNSSKWLLSYGKVDAGHCIIIWKNKNKEKAIILMHFSFKMVASSTAAMLLGIP